MPRCRRSLATRPVPTCEYPKRWWLLPVRVTQRRGRHAGASPIERRRAFQRRSRHRHQDSTQCLLPPKRQGLTLVQDQRLWHGACRTGTERNARRTGAVIDFKPGDRVRIAEFWATTPHCWFSTCSRHDAPLRRRSHAFTVSVECVADVENSTSAREIGSSHVLQVRIGVSRRRQFL